ncbi:MAG: prepilin-type N-terminal cleavage/methylation domain-containing protein [Verrucomicrobiota bacterium]
MRNNTEFKNFSATDQCIVDRKAKRNGFTLVEIMIGLVVISLLALSLFGFLDAMSKFVETQYDFVKATELADNNFKELKSSSYSDVLFKFGLDSSATAASNAVILEQTADGYTVSAVATPNQAYGTTAGDSVKVEMNISWNHLGSTKTRFYETTLIGGGLAQ